MNAAEKIIREADEAMARGDNEAFLAAHADDVVMHVAGRSRFAGTHKGKAELQTLLGGFFEATPGFRFETHDYVSNDDHVVILQRSHYERDGKSLDTNDVFIAHVADGKIAELWMISEDQQALDEFFA